MKLSPRLKYAFATLGISICVRVNVISLLRIRLLFLSCCEEKLQGYVLPDLSCLSVFVITSNIEIESKSDRMLCDAY